MAIGLATFSVSNVSAARARAHVEHLDANGNGIFEEGEVDPCQEYRCGPAKCTYPVTKFKKKNYCTKRCVKEPYTVRKKCTRYVPQYYTKKHYKYIPQYYTKTYCRQVPECYYTTETRYRTKVVSDEHCCYEPYTYCKTSCVDLNECSACDQGGCNSNGSSGHGGYEQASNSGSDTQETPLSNSNQRVRAPRQY